MTSTDVVDPRSVTLHDPDGRPVPFSELTADPLVVILVRYFGCLPCQAYLQDIEAARRRLPPQARAVAVGGSADYQARWLRDNQGIDMPLLLDPHQHIRTIAELGDLTRRQLLSPHGAANYVQAMRRGLRPQKITKDTVRSPGVAIFGPDLQLTWTYEGRMLGDYPTVDEVVQQASC
jgi:peroxiredoxin